MFSLEPLTWKKQHCFLQNFKSVLHLIVITCKSRCDKYVRLHPAFPYLVPPWVHMNTVPSPVCSTRVTFSKQRGHTLSSLFPHDKQNTCLHGICKMNHYTIRNYMTCFRATYSRCVVSTLVVHNLQYKAHLCINYNEPYLTCNYIQKILLFKFLSAGKSTLLTSGLTLGVLLKHMVLHSV